MAVSAFRSVAVFCLLAAAVRGGEPQPGRVTGERVNVRYGADTKFRIVATLNTNAPVTVLGHEEGWYKIAFPKGTGLWLSASLAATESQGGIEVAVVNGDRVNLREDSRPDAMMVTQVDKGARLAVLEKKDGWLRVEAPEGAVAWISDKFVEVQQPVPAARAYPHQERVTELVADPDAATLAQMDQLAADLKAAQEASTDETEKARIGEGLARVQLLAAVRRDLDAAKAKLDAELRTAQEEQRRREEEERKKLEAKPVWDAEGWLRTMGPVAGRPSKWVLEPVEGKRSYFLTPGVEGMDLDPYVGKRIGVKGTIEGVDEKWKAKGKLIVKEIGDLSPGDRAAGGG